MNQKVLLLLCMSFNALAGFGQDSWIKLYPDHGQLFCKSYVQGDTIYSFGSDHINLTEPSKSVFITKSGLNGIVYSHDTFDYKKLVGNKDIYYIINENGLVTYDTKSSSFLFGTAAIDTFNDHSKWRAVIIEYPSKTKVFPDRNLDTLENGITFFERINSTSFAIQYLILENEQSKKNLTRMSLYRYEKDTMIELYRSQFPFIQNDDFHRKLPISFKADKLDGKQLFMHVSERWNGEENVQDHIVKLDTQGKVSWSKRLNDVNFINTQNTQYAQLPNGNILVLWNDYEYGAQQPQNSSQFAQNAPEGGMIAIILDYETGNEVKRYDYFKNIDSSARAQYNNYTQEHSGVGFGLINRYGIAVDDGIVLCGDYSAENRALLIKPDSLGVVVRQKRLCFIMKLDTNGNFKWFREIETFPNDSSSAGTKAYHCLSTPDKGILISGESFFYTQNGQKVYATLLKLNEYGCLKDGCQTSSINQISTSINYKVIPNPSTGIISFQGLPSKKYNITVFNTSGRIVFESTTANSENVKLGHLPNGMYYLNITFEGSENNKLHKILISR